jgi:hypothetical protein
MEHDHPDHEMNRLKEQLGKLTAQVQQLERERHLDAHQIQNLTHANALQNVLEQGLDSIRQQLLPLRDLTPARTPLDKVGAAKLEALRNDAKRPDWHGDTTAEQSDWTAVIDRRKL